MGIIARVLAGGEDMRTDWTIGICDRDRTFKDGLKRSPDIKPLGLAADQHRYRLAFPRGLARRPGSRPPRSPRSAAGLPGRRAGALLRLQIRVGGTPCHTQTVR